jgi:hydrogenase maturation protein HypF
LKLRAAEAWSTQIKRVKVHIEGIVQGVGFRPFVYRLATAGKLTGWVMNTPSGVFLEAQGEQVQVDRFVKDLVDEAPPLAVITGVRTEDIPSVEEASFVISRSGGEGHDVQVAPDSDVCSDCLSELFNPADRRFRYPFINCTNCGPRYTIIRDVPYDRPHTTMSEFPMCPDCLAEYEDPANRRFHAQPNACPVCGPRLRLFESGWSEIPGDPLDTAIDLLKGGKILAIKGLGGYHLAVDACNDDAVGLLRKRKKRDEKPFALMSPGLAEISVYAEFDEREQKLLSGPERPIVLLRKRAPNPISPKVAPTNGYFGTMLPYTPLHHLLLRENFTALVMTSGNLSDEPICFRDEELHRLLHIADYFLVHNREIHTRTDDSVIRVFRGNPIFLRRSRGYVPRAITIPAAQPSVLAVGGELKGAVCLTRGDRAFISQHIGDLQNAVTLNSMEETVEQMKKLLKITPEVVAHDLHPDYLSTSYAEGIKGLPKVAVQHHHAHLASCMAENGLEGDVIGVIFDGTGYGTDGTIWGGEFLVGGYGKFERRGHFRRVPLPGGDAAVREPFRMALSYLYGIFGAGMFDLSLPCTAALPKGDRPLFLKMLERRINSPLTSSCGRLFDAVASLIGLRNRVSYDGQGAIELEGIAETSDDSEAYPYDISTEEGIPVVDFRKMFKAMAHDVSGKAAPAPMARRFHNTVAVSAVEMCGKIRESTGLERVVLSGGVFQNKLLSERIHTLLAGKGFQVYTQRLAPPNDGGVALGQAIIAGRSNQCV